MDSTNKMREPENPFETQRRKGDGSDALPGGIMSGRGGRPSTVDIHLSDARPLKIPPRIEFRRILFSQTPLGRLSPVVSERCEWKIRLMPFSLEKMSRRAKIA